MKAEDKEVNWDLENFDGILLEHPLVYKYELGLVEDDDYLDFVPASAFQNVEVELEELSGAGFNSVVPAEVNEEEPDDLNNEPCEAALAIASKIPKPEHELVSIWRTFISTVYFHPNILVHDDLNCMKELFQLLGKDIKFKHSNFIVEFGEVKQEYKSLVRIRPALPSPNAAPIFTFAHIKDFVVESDMSICIVKDYRIMSFMKDAVMELVNFVIDYPEALYLEIYGFILDFLLRFGIKSDVIIDAVMRTQRRRIKSQKPASVLILKQANLLGKGKKEYLHQRLLASPDKYKYDPVVSIRSELPLGRHLRNRRTEEPQLDDWKSTEESLKIELCDNFGPAASDRTNIRTRTDSTKVLKRQLFNNGTASVVERSINRRLGNTNRKDLYKRNVIGKRLKKKKFYQRKEEHLLVKAFSCPICVDRNFEYKGNLNVHMKKHHSQTLKTDPDPEPKIFKTKSPSSKPRKPPPSKVKEEKPRLRVFSCPVCAQIFSIKFSCQRHIGKMHPDHADWDPLEEFSAQSNASQKSVRFKDRTLRHEQTAPQNTISSKEPISSLTTTSRDLRRAAIIQSAKQEINFRIESGLNFSNKYSFPSFDIAGPQSQRLRAAVK